MDTTIPLCNGHDLQDGGEAVPFDVVYAGQTCRAFAIRFRGVAYAYLNRCAHVAMEMDYQPNRFLTIPGNGCSAPPMVRCTVRIPGSVPAAPAAAAWSQYVSAKVMVWSAGILPTTSSPSSFEMTEPVMSDPQGIEPTANHAARPAGWERGVLEKLALATLAEQRSSRRWRIFFRLAWLLVFAAGRLGMLGRPAALHRKARRPTLRWWPSRVKLPPTSRPAPNW